MEEQIRELRRMLSQAQARMAALEGCLEEKDRKIIYLRAGLATAHTQLSHWLFGYSDFSQVSTMWYVL